MKKHLIYVFSICFGWLIPRKQERPLPCSVVDGLSLRSGTKGSVAIRTHVGVYVKGVHTARHARQAQANQTHQDAHAPAHIGQGAVHSGRARKFAEVAGYDGGRFWPNQGVRVVTALASDHHDTGLLGHDDWLLVHDDGLARLLHHRLSGLLHHGLSWLLHLVGLAWLHHWLLLHHGLAWLAHHGLLHHGLSLHQGLLVTHFY